MIEVNRMNNPNCMISLFLASRSTIRTFVQWLHIVIINTKTFNYASFKAKISWQQMTGLKSQKTRFITNICILFPFIPPLSTQLRSPLKLISIIFQTDCIPKKKRNGDSRCALAHSLLCWNAALWNRKRPHADKIIEFWFVILKMIAARSVFDITVCGWEYISSIIVIQRPWYYQLTNHFQIVNFFSFFPNDSLTCLCHFFIFCCCCISHKANRC